jgi:hypothetical protein
MKPHPHAEVLRAIADGVPLSEFEAALIPGMWRPLECVAATNRDDACGWLESPDKWQLRRKPQYIMVNGFKVPKPLDVMPKDREAYFVPSFDCEHLYQKDSWTDHAIDNRLFDRHICHATKEAAIAHAKAMLGIDPEYFK